MKIQTIEIKGFRSLRDFKIDNLDAHLNLLIGINGAGKSSVLDSIALMLSAFTARLSSNTFKGLNIQPADVSRNQKTCSIILTLDNGVEWKKLKSNQLEKSEESDFSQLNEYTKGIRFSLDESSQVCLPVIVHYGVRRSVTDIPLKFPKTDNLNPTLAYVDWLDSRASYRDIFPWLRGEEDYENELNRDSPGTRTRGLTALRSAMESILPGYSDMRVRRRPHLEVVLKKDGMELALSQLSDGEKCYIALVCDIVRRLSLANPTGDILQGQGIVLIDEVDLHLHPTWEQTIMERLHRTFPNIQFIVSAHSPLVASNLDGNIYGICNGKVEPIPRIFGLDYSVILQEWMKTAPEHKEINSLIDMFRAYSDNSMPQQAQAVKDKLQELVGDRINDLLGQTADERD